MRKKFEKARIQTLVFWFFSFMKEQKIYASCKGVSGYWKQDSERATPWKVQNSSAIYSIGSWYF